MHNAGDDNILLVFASYGVLGVTAICTECVAAAAAALMHRALENYLNKFPLFGEVLAIFIMHVDMRITGPARFLRDDAATARDDLETK